MIEQDIRDLERRVPDRRLDGLEADIWARLAVQEQARRRAVRLLALQVVLLGVALGASTLAGYRARQSDSSELSVFSARMPLNASTLLAEGRP